MPAITFFADPNCSVNIWNNNNMIMPEPKNYGERIKCIPKLLNLSRNDFANSINTSNKTMSDVELCKARPNY